MVKFKNVKVQDIMTPFSVMEIADEKMSISNFYKKILILFFQEYLYIPMIKMKLTVTF